MPIRVVVMTLKMDCRMVQNMYGWKNVMGIILAF